jgi:microcystin degradation protein MlrC
MLMGFPWADIADMGVGFVVCTDGDVAAAQREADRLGEWMWRRRGEWVCELLDVAEAVDAAIALAADAPRGKPVVLADMSDNPGGGGTSDSVRVLAELLRRGETGALIATTTDAAVAAAAHRAGAGATLTDFTLGGNLTGDDLTGPPLPVPTSTVRSLSSGELTLTGRMFHGLTYDMGPTAVLEIEGNFVIVSSKSEQPWDQAYITSQGLDPTAFKYIVLKSAVHYRADFTDVAHAIVEVTVLARVGTVILCYHWLSLTVIT